MKFFWHLLPFLHNVIFLKSSLRVSFTQKIATKSWILYQAAFHLYNRSFTKSSWNHRRIFVATVLESNWTMNILVPDQVDECCWTSTTNDLGEDENELDREPQLGCWEEGKLSECLNEHKRVGIGQRGRGKCWQRLHSYWMWHRCSYRNDQVSRSEWQGSDHWWPLCHHWVSYWAQLWNRRRNKIEISCY